ncbi:molybdopterin-dependent oxidoreductase [Chloroflexota bacterium]
MGGGGVSPVDEPEVSVFRGAGLGNFGRDNTAMRVDVKDGKIVRIRPIHYDVEGYGADYLKPWSMTVNGATLQPPPNLKSQAPTIGLSYKKRVYSPNRIKFPLQRVDWEPGGDPAKINPQNRGISKYKRISWDEATDIIAGELIRIQDKYGYFAVLAQADGHGEGKVVHGPHGCMTQLLRWMGPDTKSSYTIQCRTPDSWEGFYWGGKHMWGMETKGNGYPSTNITLDMAENCDMMVVLGDKETTTGIISGQFCSDQMFWLTEVGVEMVYLAPDLNYSGAVHADKWIPVLPCQDVALYLAIANVWIKEETYDQDYLDNHSVGFDKYKDVVLGNAADGIDKTPEWASPLCGVPVHTIKALARNWAQKRTSTAQGNGGAGIRGPYSTEPARTHICLLAMQAMGAPGCAYFKWGGMPNSAKSFSFDKTLVRGEPCPARGLEEWESAYDYFRPHSFIPKTLIHDAILKSPITWNGGTGSAGQLAEDQWRSFQFPIPAGEGGSDLHMIWTSTPCWTACWNGGNRYIEALRDSKVECVVTEHPWMENDTLLSDIILPTTTKYEEYDICGPRTPESYGCVTINRDCIAPVGEAKSDYEVSLEVAKKLENLGHPGLVDKYSWGRSVEDWMEYGYETREIEATTGMTWEQFKEREIYIDPTRPDWEERLAGKPGGRAFYEDPVANPLQTPTGLLEFESTGLLQHFPNDRERPPVPNWVPGGPRAQGWSMDETLLSERAEQYPFLVISNHPRWGEHAQNDDNAWCREVETCKVMGPDGYKYHPCWINPISAEPLGIKMGDVISLYNERGTILCGAYVTERIIPGAAYVDHIARCDPIFTSPDAPRSEWIDRGGEINLICPDDPGIVSQNAPGQVASGFLVGVKRTDLDDLRVKYPEAFARSYDPDSGLRFDGWVEGGM